MPAATPRSKADAFRDAIPAQNMARLPAAVNAGPERGRHPSHIYSAAGHAFLDGVQPLHKNGSDLNAVARNYQAASRGNLSMMEAVLNAVDDPSKPTLAVAAGRGKLVDLMRPTR